MLQFLWRPYIGVEDEDPTESDMWSSTMVLICFTYVEIHHSDRVKLQFGIQQDIMGPLRSMEAYRKSRTSDQWKFPNWKDHYRQEHQEWKNYCNTVLQGHVMTTECKPNKEYIDWFKYVTILYLSQNIYLFNLRNQPTSSNFQHARSSSNTYTQQLTLNIQQSTFNTQQLTCNTRQPFNPTQQSYTPG